LLFLGTKDREERIKTIGDLTEQFKQEAVFGRTDGFDPRINGYSMQIWLDYRGWEVYSFTSLIFKNMDILIGTALTFIGFVGGMILPKIGSHLWSLLQAKW